MWGTHNRAIRLNGRHRRAADREHRNAQQALAAAKQHEAELQEAAAPARDGVQAAATRTGELRQKIRLIGRFQRGEGAPEHIAELRAALRAVDDWERWATGKQITPARLVGIIESLRSEAVSNDPDCAALATAAEHWARPRGVLPPAPALPAPQPPTPSFGIEL